MIRAERMSMHVQSKVLQRRTPRPEGDTQVSVSSSLFQIFDVRKQNKTTCFAFSHQKFERVNWTRTPVGEYIKLFHVISPQKRQMKIKTHFQVRILQDINLVAPGSTSLIRMSFCNGYGLFTCYSKHSSNTQ